MLPLTLSQEQGSQRHEAGIKKTPKSIELVGLILQGTSLLQVNPGVAALQQSYEMGKEPERPSDST